DRREGNRARPPRPGDPGAPGIHAGEAEHDTPEWTDPALPGREVPPDQTQRGKRSGGHVVGSFQRHAEIVGWSAAGGQADRPHRGLTPAPLREQRGRGAQTSIVPTSGGPDDDAPGRPGTAPGPGGQATAAVTCSRP